MTELLRFIPVFALFAAALIGFLWFVARFVPPWL